MWVTNDGPWTVMVTPLQMTSGHQPPSHQACQGGKGLGPEFPLFTLWHDLFDLGKTAASLLPVKPHLIAD